MRSTAKPTIYLSDYFTVPVPSYAPSRTAFLRKLRNRQMLWTILPYCAEAMALILVLGLTVIGFSALLLSLGC